MSPFHVKNTVQFSIIMSYNELTTGSYIMIEQHPCRIVYVKEIAANKGTAKICCGEDVLTKQIYQDKFNPDSQITPFTMEQYIYEIQWIHDDDMELMDDRGQIMYHEKLDHAHVGDKVIVTYVYYKQKCCIRGRQTTSVKRELLLAIKH